MAADPEEGFKVTDRRRRAGAEEAPPETPARSEAAPRPEASLHDDAERQSQFRDQYIGAPGQTHERSLAGLFVMLASSVAFALGEAPDPVTGETRQDLAQAAELIDLLVLLQEKTEGHRTAEETQILEEVVYDLQLRYVSATRRSAARPGPSRPSRP